MIDPLDDYFKRVNPVLKRPEEGSSRPTSSDVYRSWDRFATMIAVTVPRALDRARVARNRFLRAVQ